MGWTARVPNQLTELFVDFCRTVEHPVVDLGCAYGVACAPALAAGARVVGVDLELEHLTELPVGVERVQGRFPDLAFRAGSLGAVHASNVLHFLTGDELEEGAARIHEWLAPGGCVFVQASTPYQGPFAGFVLEYERRVREGERWPGWVPETRAITTFRRLHQYPASIHLLDEAVLRRVFGRFEVEKLWLYRRHGLPASVFLDGRESVGLVARRP